MRDIRQVLQQGPLLFDGGMGTYFSQKTHSPGSGCELANLSQPELIGDIHREYLEAGAQAIKTNSFALNRPALQGDEELARRAIRAGWELAAQAAAPFDAFVFADIGPVTALSPDQAAEEYRWVADRFLELGARHFLFETNATAAGLREAAEYIRAQAPESYIIVTFAVQPDGFSREGCFAADLLGEMRACSAVDAVGFNCVCGARHMLELVRGLEHSGVTLALMPNAGYPVVVNNRTFYDGDPAYFAAQIAEMAPPRPTSPSVPRPCPRGAGRQVRRPWSRSPGQGSPNPGRAVSGPNFSGGSGSLPWSWIPPPTPAWTSSWPGRRSSGGAGRTS